MSPRAAAVAAMLPVGAWIAGACAAPAPAPMALPACEAVEGELPAGFRADALAGEYLLVLVAESGPLAGSSASGRLALRPYGATTPPLPAAPGSGIRYPLHGSTDVDLPAVGAVAPGAAGTDDPGGPGVLAVEWPRAGSADGGRSVVLRLGADGNREDRTRFDGASMALHLAAASADGFAGRWESGAGEPVASGRFCALRAGLDAPAPRA